MSWTRLDVEWKDEARRDLHRVERKQEERIVHAIDASGQLVLMLVLRVRPRGSAYG